MCLCVYACGDVCGWVDVRECVVVLVPAHAMCVCVCVYVCVCFFFLIHIVY